MRTGSAPTGAGNRGRRTCARGRQLSDWTNKLIWGDNKIILSSLKNGPLREEIEAQGGIKLVYIDPPFDMGADSSMDIEIGDDTFTTRPNVLEEIAYREVGKKRVKLAVKLVDIFGNDTTTIVEVSMGGKK